MLLMAVKLSLVGSFLCTGKKKVEPTIFFEFWMLDINVFKYHIVSRRDYLKESINQDASMLLFGKKIKFFKKKFAI